MIPQGQAPKALDQTSASVAAAPAQTSADVVLQIPVDDIAPNPFQPRKKFDEEMLADLARSIAESGILQPVVVVRTTGGGKPYQIVAGERRVRAARIAKLKTVPAIVRSVKADDENLELAILENIQREDLNPIELGFAYKELTERFKASQDDIARKIGKSRQVVGNTMRLLTLPKEIQADIESGALSENHARAILALPTDDVRLKLWREVREQKLSARNTEVAARKYKKTPNKSAANVDAFSKSVMVELEAYLGTKVLVEPGAHVSDGGKIIIKYFSNEDLKNIVTKITRR